MQLDRITARIAPRSAWQAMDLGVRLYQHWALSLTRLYVIVSLPILTILMLCAGKQYWLHALIVFWWLKPLWERPLLEFCAQSLFSGKPTLRDIMRTLPSHTLKGVWPWLLLRRLDPSRSFHLPVTQLERQYGENYRQRTRVLGMGENDHSGSLTFVMLGLETLLLFGLVALIAMMMPNQYYLQDFDWLFEQEGLFIWVGVSCYYLATCINTPLYVCSGFALYLNKRTWLEGWDLEIGLRHIGQRRSMLQRHLLALVLALPLAGGLLPDTAFAQPPQTPPAETPQQQAIDILAEPEFTPLTLKDSWRFKDLFDDEGEEAPDDDSTDRLEAFFKWLSELFDDEDETEEESEEDSTDIDLPTLAEIVRFALWVIVVALVIWLMTKIPALRPRRARDNASGPATTHVAGLDIRPESLPDDVRSHALAALQAGNTRLALSLLYRATLSRLLHRLNIELDAGSTEYECLQRVRQQRSSPADQVAYLGRLTNAWISTAWAHRPASRETVETLAQEWPALFDTGTEVAHGA